MALIHVSELPPERQAEALGLVRLGAPRSEPEWLRCLRQSDAGRRGVLSAQASGGVLLGIAAYEAGDGGMPGTSELRVPVFVAFELGGREATRAALLAGLDGLAERFGCGGIAIVAASGRDGLARPRPVTEAGP